MIDRNMAMADKRRLCDALLRIDGLREPQTRDLYLSELNSEFGHALKVNRYPDARHDLMALINACLVHDGALRALIEVLRGFLPDNADVAGFAALVDELDRTTLMSRAERARLANLLATVERDRVAAGYQAVAPAGAETTGLDAEELIRSLEQTSADVFEVAPLIVFMDRLIETPTTAFGISMHSLIDVVGGRMGLDPQALRLICLRPGHHSGPAPGPLDSDLGGASGPQPDGVSDIFSPDESDFPGANVKIQVRPTIAPVRPGIVGGVPLRNPEFTGREILLDTLRRELAARSKVSVLPEALHGLGGVGKTELAIEYVHRYGREYDIVWWLPSEQPAQVRAALAALGERLGLPTSVDLQQTVATVLDTLSTTELHWLLVYDNAGVPRSLDGLLPSSGGHVLVTSRSHEWANATVGRAIEVDVFERGESVDLLRKRLPNITEAEADQLAEHLGDLPLALEQAANWCSATGMDVAEYVELLSENAQEILAEGQPERYPSTISAFLRLGFDKLREEAPAAAQLFEMFAFLGAEPVPVSLLRSGRHAELAEPLRHTLGNPIALNRTLRDLRRYGLAKVDSTNQRVQVHRLVQLVLREELPPDRREQARRHVHQLLAAANPGSPDESENWPRLREITPHLRPASMVDAETDDARWVVLHQLRYLYVIGDYHGDRSLGEATVAAWSREPADGGLGPDHELTLLACAYLGNALRLTGATEDARTLDTATLERLRDNPAFGPEHEHTLYLVGSVAQDLRLIGQYQQAYELEEENLQRHQRVFGEDDYNTLRAKGNLGVDLRILGDFRRAEQIDDEIVRQWQQTVGDRDSRTLFSMTNLAWDLYGQGRYTEAQRLVELAHPALEEQLGARHRITLQAARTLAILLRKAGRLTDAVRTARANHRDFNLHFGSDHEHTLAAAMTFANSLRSHDELAAARNTAAEAVRRYRELFGARHPLTLVAEANLAIVLRALGEYRQAHSLDQATYPAIVDALGEAHPYALCVATGMANNLAYAHQLDAALQLSQGTLTMSRQVRGSDHPYTLICVTNVALDLISVGREDEGQAMLDANAQALGQLLGPEHPETLATMRGKRLECEIEPPPT